MSTSVLDLIVIGDITGQHAREVLNQKLRFEVKYQRERNDAKCQQATRLLCQHMYNDNIPSATIASSLITIITK
jgi:uncharacterized protein (UPF0218 family)